MIDDAENLGPASLAGAGADARRGEQDRGGDEANEELCLYESSLASGVGPGASPTAGVLRSPEKLGARSTRLRSWYSFRHAGAAPRSSTPPAPSALARWADDSRAKAADNGSSGRISRDSSAFSRDAASSGIDRRGKYLLPPSTAGLGTAQPPGRRASGFGRSPPPTVSGAETSPGTATLPRARRRERASLRRSTPVRAAHPGSRMCRSELPVIRALAATRSGAASTAARLHAVLAGALGPSRCFFARSERPRRRRQHLTRRGRSFAREFTAAPLAEPDARGRLAPPEGSRPSRLAIAVMW